MLPRARNVSLSTHKFPKYLNSHSFRWFWPYCLAFHQFLGAFAKLRKVTLSFVMSVRLSVRPSFRMEQLGTHWTDVHDIRYLGVFRKSVEKIQVSSTSDKNYGYFT
jgi:hypothetical protein